MRDHGAQRGPKYVGSPVMVMSCHVVEWNSGSLQEQQALLINEPSRSKHTGLQMGNTINQAGEDIGTQLWL